ncbi:MAG: hypothetical protein ACRD5E_08305 [Nitrososphaeraceae archaeon]
MKTWEISLQSIRILFFLMTGRHVFKIPKSFVQGFNGSEVSLNAPSPEVLRLEL